MDIGDPKRVLQVEPLDEPVPEPLETAHPGSLPPFAPEPLQPAPQPLESADRGASERLLSARPE